LLRPFVDVSAATGAFLWWNWLPISARCRYRQQ